MLDTPLPEDLVLVHEKGDHYSLQPAREMTLAGWLAPLRWPAKSDKSRVELKNQRFPYHQRQGHDKTRMAGSISKCNGSILISQILRAGGMYLHAWRAQPNRQKSRDYDYCFDTDLS